MSLGIKGNSFILSCRFLSANSLDASAASNSTVVGKHENLHNILQVKSYPFIPDWCWNARNKLQLKNVIIMPLTDDCNLPAFRLPCFLCLDVAAISFSCLCLSFFNVLDFLRGGLHSESFIFNFGTAGGSWKVGAASVTPGLV